MKFTHDNCSNDFDDNDSTDGGSADADLTAEDSTDEDSTDEDSTDEDSTEDDSTNGDLTNVIRRHKITQVIPLVFNQKHLFKESFLSKSTCLSFLCALLPYQFSILNFDIQLSS
ncbi:unnamed protein product [Adineta ricciae]|uniref:Uncharacterized protein n=1 Tax=Adineta ricciae TaxID=249248 RepID=A0A815PUX5_ADIRI|nr:unnamed protein product [Adineta ricciae]